ncbi:MAG: ABC transporter permease [Gammaproteobacteria bacterium]|nr:ABC transporter permease [Gammaproteobacteria bacterium]
MSSLKLAWKLLRRDWAGGELRVLILALMVAVTGVSAINFFSERIQIAMIEESSTFIGADLQLTGSREADENWFKEADKLELESAKSLLFASVVASDNAFQLASVRSVDTIFPLKGSLQLNTANDSNAEINYKPQQGEVWVDSRLFSKLKIQIGDVVEVGVAEFTVTGMIESEPGRGGSLLNFIPRLVMNMDDVEKTQVIQPGSRISWQYQFAGNKDSIKEYTIWIKEQLDTTWALVGGSQGVPNLERTLNRAQGFLGLASLASLLLAGIAIAMVANRYAEHHFDHGALLRCFGASRFLVLKIYGSNLFILGLLTSIVGSVTGYLVHLGLVELMQPLLPNNLPQPSSQSFFIAVATGMAALTGFALPALMRLGAVSPLRVLRRDLSPVSLNGYFTYGLTVFTIGLIMWWQTRDIEMVVIVIAGGAVASFVLSLIAKAFLKFGLLFQRYMSGSVRFGFSQLARHSKASTIQIMAFGLALLVMMLILLLRNDLLDTWRSKLSDDTPNHFIVNVEPTEVEQMETFFSDRQIETSGMFPMIRSRINLPESATGKIEREVNITWSEQLPDHNQLEEGIWSPEKTTSGHPAMSLENKFAESMGLQLGDILGFDTGGRIYQGEITSLRSVKWDSFKPNFFVMFTSDAIKDLPADWMTSFYLEAEKKHLLDSMVEQFPAVTLIELGAIMDQVQRIIEQVSIAVEYILLFVIIAGLMVLLATIQSTMDERIFESTVLRTLGASRSYLRSSLMTEFSLLGLLAGLMAAAGTELVSYGLYEQLFKLPYAMHGWLWLVGPLCGIIIISVAGNLAARRVVSRPPMSSFRTVY